MTRLFAGTPFDLPPECERCGQPETTCRCTPAEQTAAELQRQRQAARLPPQQQTAKVSLQKRKAGRQVTVIQGLASQANDLAELLSLLQTACGSGGTVKAKENLIELQGDHVQRVRTSLANIGYRLSPKG